jgi:tetratricopeptide (TPR) repeat protein
MADRLRQLWDFDDLDASEERLRAQLRAETSDAGRAEVLTQLARIEGRRGKFDACERLLQEAEALAGTSEVARVRIDLERGRKLRSSGDAEAALPLFEAVYQRASESGEHYLAGDAAHMAALADDARMEEWSERGLALAEREPEAAYWAGPLLNNLAGSRIDVGDHERALALFQRALEVRERDPANESAIAWARYGVAEALKALGRTDEAEAAMEPARAWARRTGKPDDYFAG